MTDLRKKLLVAAFVMILSIAVFGAISKPADAISAQVTVEMTPGSQFVDVNPGASGVVTFTGIVKLTKVGPEPLPIVVSLQASSDLGGAATVSPSTVILTNTASQANVQITVKEVPGQSYTDTDVIRLSGTFTDGVALSKVIRETTAAVIINQFYRMTVSSETPYVEVKPGDQVFFNLKLENEGNGEDTFIIKVDDDNLETLTAKGWTVQLGNPKVVIEEKQKKVLSLTGTTPMKTTLWKNEVEFIKIIVTSENSGETVSEEYTFYVRQHGLNIPGFDPTFAILSLSLVGAVIVGRRRRLMEIEEEE